MPTQDFKVFLEPDQEYGGYVVVCPTLPGCYSQGKTVSEALANIREAIELVLEDMESRGEPIPDPSRAVALQSLADESFFIWFASLFSAIRYLIS